MFRISLCRDENTRRYSISPAGLAGWEVRMEENDTLRRLDLYDDWHRVERALMLFERETTELAAAGWRVAAAGASPAGPS